MTCITTEPRAARTDSAQLIRAAEEGEHLSIVENGTEDLSQYTKLPVSQIVKIKPYYLRALRIHANDIRGTFLRAPAM